MEIYGIALLVVAFIVVIRLWKSDNKLREEAREFLQKTEEENFLKQTESREWEAETLRANLESRLQGVKEILETAETLLRFNEDLLARMADEKTPLDADTLSKVQANLISKERGEYLAVIQKATHLLSEASFKKDEDTMVSLHNLCQELCAYNAAFQVALKG